MTILITGGAGYIGSHCCVTFLDAGHDVVVLDNFSNSNPESLKRIAAITGRDIALEAGDVRDRGTLERVLKAHDCTGVIHFAGLKAVGESNEKPLEYYAINVSGTLELLAAMDACDVRQLIFSSSATVYGEPQYLPLTEDHPLGATNPYGRTKQMIEELLADVAASNPRWRFGILRYFNPVGAHKSGMIGEDPRGVPNNLMPFVAQVASGRREKLSVFGDDYGTRDGTGVRDYIHVVDLVEGHLLAHQALTDLSDEDNSFTVNLGAGTGYSVLEMVKAFERASNRPIPYEVTKRRAGDVAEVFADTKLADTKLNWTAQRGLEDMCSDTWNWTCKNPQGFGGDH